MSYLADNWPELLWIAVAAGVASALAGRRSVAQWQQREFLDRLNVSLTYIDQGTLQIRTILEMDVEDIFLNRAAASELVKLAKGTTPENPLIPIKAEDRWYYLNAVLNEVSERFAEGHMKHAVGADVTEEQFLIALTCERAGRVRTQKIRALLMKQSFLENLPEDEPSYESPNHAKRWESMQFLAEQWQISPDHFLSLRLCL
ncbi:MAG: hypothetical protein AAGJ40_18440 [Planctomycetota bacterium]